MENNTQRIERAYGKIKHNLTDDQLDLLAEYITPEQFQARMQTLSESAGLNYYDAYWNIDRMDDLVTDCLDLFREIRREIPEREGAEFMKTGKRPGSWDAYVTTQDGMMTV